MLHRLAEDYKVEISLGIEGVRNIVQVTATAFVTYHLGAKKLESCSRAAAPAAALFDGHERCGDTLCIAEGSANTALGRMGPSEGGEPAS